MSDLPEGLHFDGDHSIRDAQDHPWVSIHESGARDPEEWRETIIRRVSAALGLPGSPIDYEEEGFTNRILYDVWVCITEREELSGAIVLELQKQIKDDEQGFWDIYVGPMIDRVAEDFAESFAERSSGSPS